MKTRQLARSASMINYIVAFVAILIAVNFFLYRHHTRKDLTAQKMFTISDATKSILKKMNDDVNVTLYYSENLPPTLQPQFRAVREFLDEFALLSGGRIHLRAEVPKDDKDSEESLARKGIRRGQVNVLEKDEMKVAAVYFHILVQHMDKTRVIAFPAQGMLEYMLASSLVEVTQREKPIVAFVTNDAEFRFGELFNFMRDKMGMGERYDMRLVSVTDEHALSIPKNCKTLVIVKPKDFKESELYKIDQFLMNGGTIVAFVEALNFSDQMSMFRPSPPPNIIPLLKKYGIQVNADLVEDYKSFAFHEVPAGRMGYMTVMTRVPYPQWVVAKRENFDKDNPALSDLQQILFPFANSLDFASDLSPDIKTHKLISTTDKGSHQDKPPFRLEPPDQKEFKVPDSTKSFMLVGAVSGPLVSYYKDREKPAKEKKDDKEQDPMRRFDQEEEDENAPKVDQAKDARLVVVSTAQLLNPEMLRIIGGEFFQANLVFTENTLDWLTLGTDLISIRTKPIKQYLLRPELKAEEKMKAKFIGRFAVPIIVVFAGAAWWWIRRARLQRLSQVYGR